MTRVCVRHPFERSENLCGHCGLEFCRDCVVYPNGPKKQPLCVPCALAAGGVRSTANHHPAMSRRELKRRLKERANEDQALAQVERPLVSIPPIANPFSSGWALTDEELPGGLASPHDDRPVPPPPPFEPAGLFADVAPHQPAQVEHPTAVAPVEEPHVTPSLLPPAAPTLADLLPAVAPVAPAPPAAVERKPSEFPLTWENTRVDDDGDDRDKRRSLPLLRRRETNEDDGSEASEMMAWLDEVFAPRDQ